MGIGAGICNLVYALETLPFNLNFSILDYMALKLQVLRFLVGNVVWVVLDYYR